MPGDVTIRACDPSDLLAVLEVHAQLNTSASALAPQLTTPVQESTWDRMMNTPDLTVYIAECDGSAIGTATVLVLPNLTYQCAPSAFVEAVVVALDHRRKGVATLLMRRILGDTHAAGCNKIQLLSHKRHSDDGGHQLYTSLGFEAEAEGFRLYHRVVPDTVMKARAQ